MAGDLLSSGLLPQYRLNYKHGSKGVQCLEYWDLYRNLILNHYSPFPVQVGHIVTLPLHQFSHTVLESCSNIRTSDWFANLNWNTYVLSKSHSDSLIMRDSIGNFSDLSLTQTLHL